VNEFAQLSHKLGIDIWDVIKCAGTKPFGFSAFWPSAGVGGHCIPIDPNYLAYKVKEELDQPFKFIELAEEINRGMPKYVASRLSKITELGNKRVLILGVTYKPNVADQRESPAIQLIVELLRYGSEITFFDPYVQHLKVDTLSMTRPNTLTEALESVDAVVVLQKHDFFLAKSDLINALNIPVLDTTGAFQGKSIERL
jgi:nucleotide sugar dehydrogenase